MTLPVNPNAISLSAIQHEFGGSNPISLSEYYAGGSQVAAGTLGYPDGVGTVIPSSGQIKLGNFHGSSNSFTLTISSNTLELNVRNQAISAGWDQNTKLIIVVNPNVYVYSDNTSNPAMLFTGDYPNGVDLYNYGNIIGRGGNGGSGSRGTSGRFPGFPGGAGIRFEAARIFNVFNFAFIAGGGGGGSVLGEPGGGGPGGGGGAGGGRGGDALGKYDPFLPYNFISGGAGGAPGQRGEWGVDGASPQPSFAYVQSQTEGVTRIYFAGAGGGRVVRVGAILPGYGSMSQWQGSPSFTYWAANGGEAGGAGGFYAPAFGQNVPTNSSDGGWTDINTTNSAQGGSTYTQYFGAGGGGYGRPGGSAMVSSSIILLGGAAGNSIQLHIRSTYRYTKSASTACIFGNVTSFT